MAVIYLGLLLYFKMTGGYRALTVEGEPDPSITKAADQVAVGGEL